MKFRTFVIGAASVAALAVPAIGIASAQEVFLPTLVYRTGPYAPSGIPAANGFADYFKMLNARDGGVGGAKILTEECETQYDTKQGVECYERLKSKGPLIINPFSTGITYQLIPKAPVDKVVIHSMGYGMTAAADGRWFPWVYNFPTTYWSQASAVVRYMGNQMGGLDKLKGKKIAHVFHNSPYGKEANPTLEALSKNYGYELHLLAVDHPGQEQKATWLQIRRINPDWVYVSGWGVMNSVAVKEASAIGFKMDRMIGNWWTGTEADVLPAGKGAIGYKAANFSGVGTDFPVIKDILKHVYDKGQGAGERSRVGEVLYNRTVVNAMLNVEAVREAQKKFNTKTPNGEQVRAALDGLNLTEAYIKQIGFEGMVRPVKVTCADHEGNGPVYIQQWDGSKWKRVSDWIEPMRDVVRPNLEAAAVVEGGKLGYSQRKCP